MYVCTVQVVSYKGHFFEFHSLQCLCEKIKANHVSLINIVDY